MIHAYGKPGGVSRCVVGLNVRMSARNSLTTFVAVDDLDFPFRKLRVTTSARTEATSSIALAETKKITSW